MEVRIEQISGYNDLTEENKVIFKTFIKRFLRYNRLRVDIPVKDMSINYVEDIEYLAIDPEDYEDECYISVLRIINVLKANGKKKQLHRYANNIHIQPTEIEKSKYLRFECKYGPTTEWFHVTKNGEEWY